MQLGLWTLPEHRCCYHWIEYRIPCESFERLLHRANGHCEICGRPGRENAKGVLYTDHQHGRGFPGGQHTVRGMVCHVCNCQLRLLDKGFRPPNEAEERYLRNAWYVVEFGYEHPRCWLPDGYHDERLREAARRERMAAQERRDRQRRAERKRQHQAAQATAG